MDDPKVDDAAEVSADNISAEKTKEAVKKPAKDKSKNTPVVTEAAAEVPVKTAAKKTKKQKNVSTGDIDVAKYKTHPKDTGSIQVQIAGLTENIVTLSTHLQAHKKDFDSRRGLLKMVARRRRLLTALQSSDETSYQTLIGDLGLRK